MSASDVLAELIYERTASPKGVENTLDAFSDISLVHPIHTSELFARLDERAPRGPGEEMKGVKFLYGVVESYERQSGNAVSQETISSLCDRLVIDTAQNAATLRGALHVYDHLIYQDRLDMHDVLSLHAHGHVAHVIETQQAAPLSSIVQMHLHEFSLTHQKPFPSKLLLEYPWYPSTPADFKEPYAGGNGTIDDDIRYLVRHQLSYRVLTRGEEKAAIYRWQQHHDDDAKDILFLCNQRLVIDWAKRYRSKGLDLVDLMGEGNKGLRKAMDKFEPERGFKFSTYASWWIQQSLRRGLLEQKRLIRLPPHVPQIVRDRKKAAGTFTERNGRRPTPDEMFGAAVGQYCTIKQARTMEPRELQGVFEIYHNQPLAGDSPLTETTRMTFFDLMRDESVVTSIDQAHRVDVRAYLRNVMDVALDERERYVIEHRFPLEEGEYGHDSKLILEEIGRVLDLTRERIRQIESRALRKLEKHISQQVREGKLHESILDLLPKPKEKSEADDEKSQDDLEDYQ